MRGTAREGGRKREGRRRQRVCVDSWMQCGCGRTRMELLGFYKELREYAGTPPGDGGGPGPFHSLLLCLIVHILQRNTISRRPKRAFEGPEDVGSARPESARRGLLGFGMDCAANMDDFDDIRVVCGEEAPGRRVVLFGGNDEDIGHGHCKVEQSGERCSAK